MNVEINGKPYNLEREVTIAQLLTQLNIPPEHGVAVALNHTVIPRSLFMSTRIKDGDQLEIVHATAGG
jgi:sulfur carrier protein